MSEITTPNKLEGLAAGFMKGAKDKKKIKPKEKKKKYSK